MFIHKRSFQNNSSFFVTLIIFGCKLVNPAQFAAAIATPHIPHHVSPREHLALLYLTVEQVDCFAEEECAPSCTREAGRDELVSAGQVGAALFAVKAPRA